MKKGRYYNNQLKGIDDESVIDSILGGQTERFSILVDRYADEVMLHMVYNMNWNNKKGKK